MFTRVFVLLPFALLAAATEYTCSTHGTADCCSQYGAANSPAIVSALNGFAIGGLLGAANLPVNAVVALHCTGIVGTGSECNQQAVCCDKVDSASLIGLNCSPADVL